MAQSDFISELEQLGYIVEKHSDSRIAFPYTIPVGRMMGTEIKLGFDSPDDFPITAPSGAHV